MSSAAQKKNKKPLAPVDITITEGMHEKEVELAKKIRNGRKKLNTIADLVKQSKAKEIVLNDEQKSKVSGQKALEDELNAQEQQLRTFRETLAGEVKQAKELEQQRQKEVKKARENAISQVADLLVIINARTRGVSFDANVSAGVGVLSEALSAIQSGGESLKSAEREAFNKIWTAYVNGSNAKVPGQEITYAALAEAISAILALGYEILPAQLPAAASTSAAPAAPTEEAPKAKKAPKPIPKEYIHKAVDNKVVADEDKQEEVVNAPVDDDFLGGFDAFDESGDDQPTPAAAKVEAKAEPEAQQDETVAEGDSRGRGRGGRGARGRWEDNGNGETRGRGGRGARGRWEDRGGGERGDRGRGGRGRGGRGRGGNQNEDDEGFATVTDEKIQRGRGRGGRGDRGRGERGRGGRGERGNRGRGGENRPDTAVGQELSNTGGKEIGTRGTRGGRPQSTRIPAEENKEVLNQAIE